MIDIEEVTVDNRPCLRFVLNGSEPLGESDNGLVGHITMTMATADALWKAMKLWRQRRAKDVGRYHMQGHLCEVCLQNGEITAVNDRSDRCFRHRKTRWDPS